VLRFRVLNLFACVVLTGFNAALEIWPMLAMNIALCLINLWHIRKLVGTRHDEASYDVLEVGPGRTPHEAPQSDRRSRMPRVARDPAIALSGRAASVDRAVTTARCEGLASEVQEANEGN
jgi:hypothetical protein